MTYHFIHIVFVLFCFFQSDSCAQKHVSTTGRSKPKPGWGLKNIFNSVWQPLLLFYKTNLRKKIIKAYQNTWVFWQQLFGLLHNIAISLKSIRLTWKLNNHCWKNSKHLRVGSNLQLAPPYDYYSNFLFTGLSSQTGRRLSEFFFIMGNRNCRQFSSIAQVN